MITLGIETSCDETACALLQDDRKVLSSIIVSQIKHHRRFKGVVPEIASRQHVQAIQPVLEEALSEADCSLQDIDLIGVTHGPGLAGALMVGVSMAKSLSQTLKVPLVGVNHLEAHLEPFFMGKNRGIRRFPFLGLVASGGHTCLVEARTLDSYYLLGETRDDAAGEAFDKVAKILDLGFPGGPVIEQWARKGDPHEVRLPDALPDSGLDFSFSGLKTAVLYYARKHHLTRESSRRRSHQHIADLCASFQQVVIHALIQKSLDACKRKRIRRLVVGGGVSANQALARQMRRTCQQEGVTLFYPERSMTTDNAIMVGLRGFRMWHKRGASGLELSIDPSLSFTGDNTYDIN